MRAVSRLFLGLIAIPIVLLLIGIAWTGYLTLAGYYVHTDAESLAHLIAEKKLDPRECLKLYVGSWSYPSQGSLRDLCTYRLAQIKKDSTVCENLMPSQYGVSCAAEIGGDLQKDSGEHCYLPKNNQIMCNEKTQPYERYYTVNQNTDCKSFMQDYVQDYCYISKASSEKNISICDSIKNSTRKDNCLSGVAFENQDPQICQLITNTIAKSHCSFFVTMKIKYPDLFKNL